MPLIFFEPVSFGKVMLVFGLVMVVLGAVGIVVGYYLLKWMAGYLNNQRDEWQETATALGLEMQSGYARLQQPLKGVYQSRQVEVTHEAEGEHPFTVCRVELAAALPFYVEIKPQNALNWFAGSLGSGDIETGVDAFDKYFWVEGDEQDVPKLLNAYLPDGDKPNLIVEMLSLRKAGRIPRLSGTQVSVGEMGQHLDLDAVKSLLDATINLAKRIEKAGESLVK